MFYLFLSLIGRRPLSSIMNRHIREAQVAEKHGNFIVIIGHDGSLECWHSTRWMDHVVCIGEVL